MTRQFHISVLLLAFAFSAHAEPAAVQDVTTFGFLDNLATAKTRSPYLPAKRPLFNKVVPGLKRNGTTVQNDWGGDGVNNFMHVRVRKVYTPWIQQDLRDCLVVPLPGSVEFKVHVFPQSRLNFSPEYFRFSGPTRADLTISVLANGKETVIYTEKRRASRLWKDRWVEQSHSLDAWANQDVTIKFTVDNPRLGDTRWERASGRHKGVGLFALPRVLTRVAAGDLPARKALRDRLGFDMNRSVIMFVFDSLRADLITPVRDERKRIPPLTPNLDKFMDKGVRFTRAFSVGNQTRTGSYAMYLSTPASVNGTWSRRWTYSPAARRAFYKSKPVSLPRELHKAGYLTGMMGYNSFLYGNQYLAMDMGFDHVSEFYGVPKNTVNMVEAIGKWLERHKHEKIFLIVWWDPPHFPYFAPKGFKQRIYKAGVKKDFRYFAHGYLAKLVYGDEYFGRLVSKMDSLGITKNSLFVLTADHGEAMDPRHDGYSSNVNTRVARQHGKSFYDEELHVPLLFRGDGWLRAKVDVPKVVSLMGLAPTIQALVGLPTNLDKQYGKSFAGLVEGTGQPDLADTAYFEGRWSYGIRTERYKYIYHDRAERLKMTSKKLWQRKRDGTDELFDLKVDPEELENIATTQPEVLKQVKKRYFDYRKELRDFRTRVFKGDIPRPIAEL